MVDHARPQDFEVGPSGMHRALTESDIRIRELESEVLSLSIRLLVAEVALGFTPATLAAIKKLVKDLAAKLEQGESDG